MPFKTYATKADFDSDYRIGAEPQGHPNTRPEIKLNYCRAVMFPVAQKRAAGIITAMNWSAPGPAIVIVGAGFGWLAECFEASGFTRVIGIDTSAYIQSAKSTTEEADVNAAITAVGLNSSSGEGATIKGRLYDGGNRSRASRGVLNQDGGNTQSRNAIRSALGLSGNQQPDWLLSEDMLPALTDAEVVNKSAQLRNWVPNVAHYTTAVIKGRVPASSMNWKTLEQWKALIPNDILIEAGTYRVL